VASGPAASYGKSTEEMYDEIIHLKKILHVTIAERDVYRGKVLRFEKEVLKKDKQIEDLLAAGHVPSRDMTRSLVEKKSSLSSTISSLRQQIHSYEAQLKEKEKIIAAMAQDLRSTAMQELEIQANTYYAEIVRLQKIVEKQAAALQSYTPRTVREGEVRTKALSDAVKNLSDELLEVTQAKADLEKEVEQLRKRVGSIPSATHRETGERGQLADKYADLKKDEMISSLVDLEMALKERNKQIEDLEANMKTEQESYQKQIDCVIDEAAGLKEKAQSLEEKLAEDDAYRHKLRKIIKQLKEDRNHYRSLAEQTKGELEGVRREVTSQTEQTVCLQEKLDTAQESLSNEERARKHAQELAKRKANIFMQDKKKLDKAAEIVQNAWKRWRSWKRQRKYEKEMDSIVEDLQAALRGHVARQYFLKDSSSVRGKDNIEHSNIDDDDEEEEEAIETIQSVFRGHLSRTVVVRS
jgi:DNA repair exonuclease SbcCD ATPase subunit